MKKVIYSDTSATLTNIDPPYTGRENLMSTHGISSACTGEKGEMYLTENEMSFDLFWETYPKKTGKKAAQKCWDKLTREEQTDCIHHLQGRVGKDEQWKKDGGKFIPMPTTFLNQGRWDDVYDTARSQEFTREPVKAAEICSGCRSMTITRRHMLICEQGGEYFDYITVKDNVTTEHVI